MRGWIPALRIARREAMRAKRRSALVLAMIALPVTLLSFAAITFDMFTLTPHEQLERRIGSADALLTWASDHPVRQGVDAYSWGSAEPAQRDAPATEADVLAVLPPGSRVAKSIQTDVRLRNPAGRATEMPARVLDIGDPLFAGRVSLVEGTVPAKPDEVTLNRNAANEFNVRVGGTIQAVSPDRTLTVVGIVEFPEDLNRTIALRPDAVGLPAHSRWGQADWLADLPGDLDWAQVLRLNAKGILVTSRSVVLNPPPAALDEFGAGSAPNMQDGLMVGLLIGGLGTLEIVLLAGPAFAVGARRRSRDLALIAAAGGDPKQLRRIVLADGVVLGAAGAITGLVLGTLLAIAGRPLIEAYLAQSRAGGWRFFPLAQLAIASLAVGTGLLAAMVPAFTAARQDVVQVLSGRRGMLKSRRRWIVIGSIMTAAGASIALWGGFLTSETLILLGIIVGELGLVMVTPALVGFVARAGRWLPLAPRLALRDTARNRSSAAPAISAVMAAVAGAVAVGVFVSGNQRQQVENYQPSLPMGHVGIQHFPRPGADVPNWTELVTAVRKALPTADVHLYQVPTCADQVLEKTCDVGVLLPLERRCPWSALDRDPTRQEAEEARNDKRCQSAGGFYGGTWVVGSIVDDGSALEAFTGGDPADLARAREVLAAGGVVVTDPNYERDGRVTLVLYNDSKASLEQLPTLDVPGYAMRSGTLGVQAIVSPAVLKQVQLGSATRGLIADTDAAPSPAEEEQLNQLILELVPDASIAIEREQTAETDPISLILALAAAAIALGAAGIATGLAGADRLADLGTLASVGAAPGVRRRLALSQAGIISGLGALLGMIAGLGGAGAMILALNQVYANQWPAQSPVPFAMPWQTLAVIVAVPLVAMAGAGLLSRARLPIERRF